MKEKLYNRNFENINKGFIIEYYKLEKEKENMQIKENEVVYGVEVVKKDKENERISEVSYIDNITKNENEINSLLKVISKNNVTPVSLEYIIEDMYKIVK